MHKHGQVRVRTRTLPPTRPHLAGAGLHRQHAQHVCLCNAAAAAAGAEAGNGAQKVWRRGCFLAVRQAALLACRSMH
eukprot:41977-Chlamydomonas_euryale.AAC.1